MMAAPATFDVIIEQPHSDVNTYAYDERTRAIRLESVVRIGEPALANRGIVVGAVTPRGEPLRAWLLSDLPISPHARVEARAVGAIEFSRGELLDRVIVAAPLADARYASVRSFNDLPRPQRAALQRMVEESARWLDAKSAEELIHLARQRARLAQVEHRTREPAHPAWESGSEFAFLDHLARETDIHTQAEAALFTLPFRFQQYIRLCLNPNERILFWVHRPRFAINRSARVGGKTLREGLLLITDQQLLWMVDPVTPSVAIEGYGYVARAVPLELLADAAVSHKRDCAVLQIASTNVVGESDAFEIEFPLPAHDELMQVERLLCAFVPRPNDRRLRRVVTLRPQDIQVHDPMESAREKTLAVIAHLQSLLAAQLDDEIICAQAFVPTWADGSAKLLTVTDRTVCLTSDSASSRYDVRAVIAPEICFSVLGSWLRVIFPKGKHLEIRFPPTAFKGFNACWLTMRQLNANVR